MIINLKSVPIQDKNQFIKKNGVDYFSKRQHLFNNSDIYNLIGI